MDVNGKGHAELMVPASESDLRVNLHFQHLRFVSEAKSFREPDVLWIGDSLIQNLLNTNIWERNFCQMHSLNFGIGGDRTETVLWRLENGELDGLAPKVIVLLVGTNNHGDSAEDIAEGIKAICSLIRDKQPQAYLVVLVRPLYRSETYPIVQFLYWPCFRPFFLVASNRTPSASAMLLSTAS